MGRFLLNKNHLGFAVCLWTILSVIVPNLLLAQDPFARKIAFLEGLPTQTIFDMHVSSSGLLYLGTNKGLVSFDGARFEEYSFGNNLGISVHRIQQDDEGTLWCMNFSNQVFYLEENLLKPLPEVDSLFYKSEKNLIDFVVTTDGLWLLTEYELYFMHFSGETELLFSVRKDRVKDYFTGITLDSSGDNAYIAAIDKIYHFNNKKLVETSKSVLGQKEILYHNGEIYFNTKAVGDQAWVLNSGKINTDKVLPGSYYYSLRAVDDELWLLTSNGAYKVDTKNRKIEEGYFKEKRITDIVKDKEGNHWLSTINEGVFMVPSPHLKIVNPIQNSTNKIVNYRAVGFDNHGNVFVGTNDGKVLQLNNDGQLQKSYDTNFDIEIEYLDVYDERIFTSIGIFSLHDQNLKYRKYYGKQFVKDNRGNLVYASSNAAIVIPISLRGNPNLPDFFDGNLLKDFGENDVQYYPIRNIRSRTVHFSEKNNTYYLGFNDGLYFYNSEVNEKEITFADGSPIIASRIVEDQDGSLWISTSQNGLLQLKDDKIVSIYTQENGLMSNQLKRVAVDELAVWVISDKGIDRLDKKAKNITNVSLNMGLKGITVNDIGIDKQKVWLATNEGVVFFDKKIAGVEIEPSFEIAKVLANGRTFTNTKLKSIENNIEFFFQTRFYRSLGNFEFEYLLEGVDTTWQRQPAIVNQVKYLALKPGNYTFHARVRSGKSVGKSVYYDFQIEKPLWQQAWFIGIAILVLFGFFFLVYRLAVYKTRKQQRVKEQLAQSQLTALRSQMNPHFMFNILNAVQGLIYSNQKTKASEYLATFSDLVRKILDNSDKKEVSIEQEIETIKLYIDLEKGRFEEDSFFYEINLPHDEDLSLYNIPSLLIQPYVENAIKHGLMHKKGMKRLELTVQKDTDTQQWRFIIEDNGVGREASGHINNRIKKHASFATNAIENRIQLINKINKTPITIRTEDLVSVQGEVLGTRIVINIPFSST